VATSVAGFVQQLAVSYIARGYYFYVQGRIPDPKDPTKTDAKLIAQYGLDISQWTRARRKLAGQASVQYLRHGRFFVLVATHGQHPFFAAEGDKVCDFRRRPLHFQGYSIGCRRTRGGGTWHASVRIEREVFRELKERFKHLACHRSVEDLCCEFRAIPYEPYAPVRDQLRILLRAVNRWRRAADLEPVPIEALRQQRVPVRTFAEADGGRAGSR
jgi:hypothetical protein